MALIRGGGNPLHARLMGWWESWCMIEYLLVDALDTKPFAAKMLTGGHYSIPRHQILSTDVQLMWDKHLKELATMAA